jgi:RecA-family ATPase
MGTATEGSESSSEKPSGENVADAPNTADQSNEELITKEQIERIRTLKVKLGCNQKEWVKLLAPYGLKSAHDFTCIRAEQFIRELEFRTPAGQIARTLGFLHPNGIFEIAIIGSKKQKSNNVFEGFAGGRKPVIAGWSDEHNKAIELIRKADSLHAEGIYLSLNPCNSALLSRANNRLRAGIGRTKDVEIKSLNNLLIDIDPLRPEGISSTDKEHRSALQLAAKIKADLAAEFGFPEPLVGDSGNGAHLVFRLPGLPNSQENVDLLKECLAAISTKYSTSKANVDRQVFNPSRLTKVYGSRTRKGDHTSERPHRFAWIISVPDQPEAITVEQLSALAATAPEEEQPLKGDHQETTSSSSALLDVTAYLGAYGINIREVKPHGSATLYILYQCLFNESHGPKEAAIVQTANGALRYQCFHDGCRDRKWVDARSKISGDASLKPFMIGGSNNADESSGNNANEKEFIDNFSAVALEDLSPARFLESEAPEYEWELVDSLLEGTVGALIAKGGIGKSQLLLQWAVCHAGGIPFLDSLYEVSHKGKVFCLFAEDPEIVLHHRLRDILTSLVDKDKFSEVMVRLNENLYVQSVTGYDTRLLSMDKGNYQPSKTYESLLQRLQGIEDLSLVVIDPLSRFFSGDENDATLGTFFISLLERICETTTATVITSHHVKKGFGTGRKSLTQEASRGSTALINAVRWQLTLASADYSDFKKGQISRDEIHKYLVAKVTKKNTGPAEGDFFLKRGKNGVLRLGDLNRADFSGDDFVLQQIIRTIIAHEEQGNRYTKTQFSENFKSTWPGYGRDKLKRIIEQAISDGRITEIPATNQNGRTVNMLSIRQ